VFRDYSACVFCWSKKTIAGSVHANQLYQLDVKERSNFDELFACLV